MDIKTLRQLNEKVLNSNARFIRAELAMKLAQSDLAANQKKLQEALIVYSRPVTVVNVRLTSYGPNQIAVIKAIRELTGMMLKESKDITDYASVSDPRAVFLHSVDEETAKRACAKISEAGGYAGIEDAR